MMKRHVLSLQCFFFVLLVAGILQAAPPVVSNITITDVTPVSFSVVWEVDQAGTCDLKIFTDENGSNEITPQLVVTPFPTRNGNQAVADAARDMGMMKVQVTGLSPASTYFFRTTSTSVAGNEVTLAPATAPYLAVTTATAVDKTVMGDTGDILYSNDVLYRDVYLADGVTPARGAILLASVAGGRYPLSSFVGDGFAGAGAGIDLNNFYNTDDDANGMLAGGQGVTLTACYGMNGRQRSIQLVPRNHNLLAAQAPVGLADTVLILQAMTSPTGGPDLSHIADIDQDGYIGLPESIHIMEVLGQVR